MINLTVDTPIKLLCLIILFLILGYISLRLFSKALFISYFEAKLKFFKFFIGGKHGKNIRTDEKRITGKNEKEL